MARPIGDNDLAFLEDLIAMTRDIEMASKRALYWTEDPEVASQLAMILAASARIQRRVIEHRDARVASAKNGQS